MTQVTRIHKGKDREQKCTDIYSHYKLPVSCLKYSIVKILSLFSTIFKLLTMVSLISKNILYIFGTVSHDNEGRVT